MQISKGTRNSNGHSSEAVLEYTPEVAVATRPIFERLRGVLPEIEWPIHAPYVAAINELKCKRNAVILAHNYQT
ncbi:MAG: quinolinate synthase NadA, partial [Pyrinomonadaceae bacterium]